MDQTFLARLADKFRTDKGPDFEMAAAYLRQSKESLEECLEMDEGIFGVEVWAAAETLKLTGQATPLSTWILSDRKGPIPHG